MAVWVGERRERERVRRRRKRRFMVWEGTDRGGGLNDLFLFLFFGGGGSSERMVDEPAVWFGLRFC